MVKKLHSPQAPTPTWVDDGKENKTWRSNSGSQASAAQSPTKPPPVEQVQRSVAFPPVQPTLAEPTVEPLPVDPVQAAPAAADIQRYPKDLGALFAKRPLVLGENEADYDELLSQVTAAVKPTDTIETLWIKDVVDLMWESQRLRRLKASLLMTAGQQALTNLLSKTKDAGQVNGVRVFTVADLVAAYAGGDPTAVAEVERILHRRGHDADSLMAQALAEKLDDVERIDRMIAGADARRNRALGELERRRDSSARRGRRTGQDITDVAQP